MNSGTGFAKYCRRWTEDLTVKRNFVKIARIRIEDVQIGDVVNRDPEKEVGWFEVERISTLFNGELQLADRTSLITISGPFFTLVGVQFVSEAEVPNQPPSPLPPIEEDATGGHDEDQKPEAPSQVLATPAALAG